MRRYRSDGERNIWHGLAERIRDNGRAHADPARFVVNVGMRRLGVGLLMFATAGLTLLLWRACT